MDVTAEQEAAYKEYRDDFDPTPDEQWQGYKGPLHIDEWLDREERDAAGELGVCEDDTAHHPALYDIHRYFTFTRRMLLTVLAAETFTAALLVGILIGRHT